MKKDREVGADQSGGHCSDQANALKGDGGWAPVIMVIWWRWRETDGFKTILRWQKRFSGGLSMGVREREAPKRIL